MRHTRPLFAHLGVPKTSQVRKYFLYYMAKKCIGFINELQADQKQPSIISSRGYFYSCIFSNVLHSNIFIQHQSVPEPLWYMRFPVCLLLTYGSLRGIGAFQRIKPVRLGEPVRTHMIQTLIYGGVHYFAEPSEASLSFIKLFII